MLVRKIVGCARCGNTHHDVKAMPLDRPFSSPEAAPVSWTHWAQCPTNGQPIMFTRTPEPVVDESHLHGKKD